MKEKRKIMMALVMTAFMLMSLCPASAAVIEDQPAVTYLQNGTVVAPEDIQPGDLKAKVRIVSESADKNQSFALILAAYKSDRSLADVSYQPMSSYKVTAEKVEPSEMIFETNTVQVPDGGSAKVYIWKDMVPAGVGVGIINRGTYCLSSVKVGSYPTVVDTVGKRILVNTDEDISSAAITGVKLPSGASYQMSEGNKEMTVTGADGTQIIYPVIKTGSFVMYDFEGKTGALSKTDKKSWFDHSNATENVAVEYAADPLDSQNTVIKLTDSNTSGSAIARLNVTKEYPYTVSYRVMYDQPNDGDNISYSSMRLYNGSPYQPMAGGSATAADGSFVFTAECDGAWAQSSKAYFELRTWHEVSLEFIDASTVKYYYDGKLFYTGVPGNVGSLDSLRFATHKGNTCTVYLDDVMIRDYYLMGSDLVSASFKDGAGNAVAGYLYEGTVYANTADVNTLTLDSYEASEGAIAKLDDAKTKITVTSSEGKKQEYPVVPKSFFTDDFESYTENAVLQTVNPTWFKSTTNESNRSALVAADGNNKVLRQKNNSNKAGFVYTQINIPNSSESFVVQYRVRYGLVDGTEFDAADSSPLWSYVGSKDGGSYALQPTAGSENAMTLQGVAKSSASNIGTVALNKWYTMKIVYEVTTEGDTKVAKVSYYMDGKALKENMDANAVAEGYVEFRASKRTCQIDYDDIIILPLD